MDNDIVELRYSRSEFNSDKYMTRKEREHKSDMLAMKVGAFLLASTIASGVYLGHRWTEKAVLENELRPQISQNGTNIEQLKKEDEKTRNAITGIGNFAYKANEDSKHRDAHLNNQIISLETDRDNFLISQFNVGHVNYEAVASNSGIKPIMDTFIGYGHKASTPEHNYGSKIDGLNILSNGKCGPFEAKLGETTEFQYGCEMTAKDDIGVSKGSWSINYR